MKEFLDELKNIHRRFSEFELVIVIIFILIVLFIPYKPNIIGFSDVDSYRQNVNLALDSSRSFVITPNKPVTITSLSISGEVLGNGAASVYLIDNNGQKLKVFANEQKGMNLITGFYGEQAELSNSIETKEPILNINEGILLNDVETVINSMPGEFFGACSDTCSLNTDSNSFELVAYVEPGTTLIIKELDYTAKN